MSKITGCAMACIYAKGPISECECSCEGSMHSLMVPMLQPARCTPSVAVRCKNGKEGECRCACAGVNHGLYRTIGDYSNVKINYFHYE